MPLLRITNVWVDDPPRNHIHGAHIDLPRPQATRDVYGFDIEGWALGNSAPVERIEVLQEGRIILHGPLGLERSDIASQFPDAQGAGLSGFRVPVGALSLRQDFEVLVRVRLESGLHVRLGIIKGRREAVQSDYEAVVQPLMANTIGRSGSTWLVWLLSCHPQIVAFKPFEHETRVASYWMSVLQALSQPRSYLAQFDPPDLAARNWWLGAAGTNRGVLRDGALAEWLGRDSPQVLAAMAQSRIDAFYRANTGAAGNHRYFVEKFSPWQVVSDLLSELYPDAKELILVRDFRDMFCSISAFNARRGRLGFARDRVGSDAEYIRTIVRGFAKALLRRWRGRRGTAHLVRYEDLILRPEETLSELLHYLELDRSEAVVKQVMKRAQNPPGAQQHQTAKSPTASIGRWQRDLSEELKVACEETLGPALAEFGYEPTVEREVDRV
jgi:hypothetical protein